MREFKFAEIHAPIIAEATPLTPRTAAAIIELLERERLMTLACLRPDGWPQATTVGYLNEDLDLFFIIARKSQKFANLQGDPRASIAIRHEKGSSGGGVGLSMAGLVTEIDDPEAVNRLNQRMIERYPNVHVYCPSKDTVAVMRFRPSVISAAGVAGGRSDPETFIVGAPKPIGAPSST